MNEQENEHTEPGNAPAGALSATELRDEAEVLGSGGPAEPPVEDVDPEGEEEELPFVYSITSYGADYPVDSLVKRMSQGAIAVPDF